MPIRTVLTVALCLFFIVVIPGETHAQRKEKAKSNKKELRAVKRKVEAEKETGLTGEILQEEEFHQKGRGKAATSILNPTHMPVARV